MTHAARLRMVKTAIRSPYAWPGGYPLYLVMGDVGALSLTSARACWREIVSSVLGRDRNSGWHPAAVEINWEDGDLICDHSGERIESAYAEPEA